jgi:glycine cleavage system H protein
MGSYPTDRKYTHDHEWALVGGSSATIGITAYAQESLGEVVYVELPAVGTMIRAGQPFGVVESTKAVSELFAPITGKVTAVNSGLSNAPETIAKDPHGEAAYEKHVAAAAH